MTNILVLGGSKDSILLVQKLTSYGFDVILADINEHCSASSYATKFLSMSILDWDGLISIIDRYEIHYCLTRSSGIAAKNCYHLNQSIHGPIVDNLAEQLLNKYNLQDFCKLYGIDYPFTMRANSENFIKSEIKPLVLKPIYEKVGKVTTFFVDTLDDFEEKVAISNQNSQIKQSILQQYLDGIDVSLTGYCCKGIFHLFNLYLEKNTKENNTISHDGFSQMDLENNILFLNIAQKICKQINIPITPLNIGFRVCNNSIYLLECNLDFGGENLIERSLEIDQTDIISLFIQKMEKLLIGGGANEIK